MSIPLGDKLNYEKEISKEEYEIIKKFLAYYRNQSVIVADSYKQLSSIIPLENARTNFKINEDKSKKIKFRKRIFHKGKPYVIELELSRTDHMEDKPKCLGIHEFKIISNNETHIITLDTFNITASEILFDILSIFDEKRIISPEQAYSRRMYTNKALRDFIKNHEWQKIETGIKQMPKLDNSLFVIREGFNRFIGAYVADFGTILYQLISFRMNNLNNLDEKDLKGLDDLILKLRKTQLLKVQLYDSTSEFKSHTTGSILLESNNSNINMHTSHQYTKDNTELLEEQKILTKCVSTKRK